MTFESRMNSFLCPVLVILRSMPHIKVLWFSEHTEYMIYSSYSNTKTVIQNKSLLINNNTKRWLYKWSPFTFTLHFVFFLNNSRIGGRFLYHRYCYSCPILLVFAVSLSVSSNSIVSCTALRVPCLPHTQKSIRVNYLKYRIGINKLNP